MKRKRSQGDSRDLRVLRKLAHERAAQIGAPDRPPLDLEEILGVPIPGAPGREVLAPPTVGPDRVHAESAESPPEPVRGPAGPVVVEAHASQPGPASRCDFARLSGEGARYFRILTELQLSTLQMLAAPFMNWSRIQREAANWYLMAIGQAIHGMPKGCDAGRSSKSAL
jgi:hypothetical protein